MSAPTTGGALRYVLRFQVVPGPRAAREAGELAAFCATHGIREVALFYAAEEWNNGLLSAREEEAWFDTIRRSKRILERNGVGVSLNPWMTILHCDRGRRFPPDRRFAPAVSPRGERARAVASFADPAWRRYFLAQMRRFAALGFRTIWIEDDFRYHNHAPLTWGSGFEPPILRALARRLGRRVTREALVRNVLRPGRPHAWRRALMETWRDTQLEVAALTARAVREASPCPTRLGLMSSHPSHHSAEGRDWTALFDALSIDGGVVHRPHFAPYGERPGKEMTYPIQMLDVQKSMRPAACEVLPEIENFPFSPWSKSDTQTWAEMALCLFNGSDGLLLDVFPFSGNRVSTEPRIGGLLDRARPALEWIGQRFARGAATRGVGVVWKPDAQAWVRTSAGRSMGELNADPLSAGSFLLPLGVPVTFGPGRVQALFGTTAWAVPDAEVRALLAGGLILDGVSADILQQRGFARWLGVSVKGIPSREESPYAMEVLAATRARVGRGFRFNVNLAPAMARLVPGPRAREWTTVLTAGGERFGAGLTTFANSAGGRVAVLACPGPALLPGSDQRQAIVQDLVRYLAGGRLDIPFAAGVPHAMTMHIVDADAEWVVVLNTLPDPARLGVRLPARLPSFIEAFALHPLGRPSRAPVEVRRRGGERWMESRRPLPYLGFLVLRLAGRPAQR